MDRARQNDLISATARILKLGSGELRVTEHALISKNPNYSLCDAILRMDTVYCIEYLLSYWESKLNRSPCFVFKNTGCAVSLSCYVQSPARLVGCGHVKEFNVLRVNESLIVDSADIEQIKPCSRGILTNCVIRKSTTDSAYSVELVAFGPESETEYEDLLRELYVRRMQEKARSGAQDGPRPRPRLRSLSRHRWNAARNGTKGAAGRFPREETVNGTPSSGLGGLLPLKSWPWAYRYVFPPALLVLVAVIWLFWLARYGFSPPASTDRGGHDRSAPL